MPRNSSPGAIRSRLDFWQAASGAVLALFICVHLILEGTVVISPDITNFLAWLLEVTYIAHIAAPCLILLIVFHFWIAARKMPFRAGELQIFVRHSRALRETDTWLWLVQVFSAIIILVCGLAHVWAVMTDLPITAAGTSARLHGGWIVFYAVFLPAIILHTGIGIYRLLVKFAVIRRASREKLQKIVWTGMGCYLLLGILALGRSWFLG